jgi:phage-related protein
MKLAESHAGETYRAAYVIAFTECVYLLHVFQKKSVSGRSTPRPEKAPIEARWRATKEHHRQYYGATKEKK